MITIRKIATGFVLALAMMGVTVGTVVTTAPVAQAAQKTYTVKSGDTLHKIATKYKVTVAALAKANKIKNVNLIRVGQKLTIPGKNNTEPKPSKYPKAPGTNVSSKSSQQVIVFDRTSGTHGTYKRYEFKGGTWVRVGSAKVQAVFGQGGVVAAKKRKQNTRTTPAGNFGVVHTFGAKNPGSTYKYRKITTCSWWIQDVQESDYNRWRESCTKPPKHGAKENERLSAYRSKLYKNAVVLDYNYKKQDKSGAGSGSGIFIHFATTYTGGCVAVNSQAELAAIVKWLDPKKNPRVIIKA